MAPGAMPHECLISPAVVDGFLRIDAHPALWLIDEQRRGRRQQIKVNNFRCSSESLNPWRSPIHVHVKAQVERGGTALISSAISRCQR